MAPPFGSTTGPFYPFGKFTVAAPGTPIGLSTTQSLGVQAVAGGNVASTTGFGTPVGGIPGETIAGLPAQLVCNGLLLFTPPSNNGLIYLCFAGTAAQPGNKNVPNSIILGLPPNYFFPFILGNASNPFMPGMFVVDADTAANVLYVTAVIL
jgi:hypothetical protein